MSQKSSLQFTCLNFLSNSMMKFFFKLQTIQHYTLLKFRVAVAKGPYLSSLQEMEAIQVTAVLSTVT